MKSAIPSVAAGFSGVSHNPGMAVQDQQAATPPAWAERFRAHMKRHKLSQEWLGQQFEPELTQATIGHWLRGRSKITLEQFLGLCAAAGADPREILFGQTSAQAALDTLKDHVLTRGPDKQFVPPNKPAETTPLGANTSHRGASKPPKRPKTPETASGRSRGR